MEHLQGNGLLRELSDYNGDGLIDNVLSLVRKHKPPHLSIVGGEPLVRFHELQILLPQLSDLGIAVQLVTSAVREIPKGWNKIKGLHHVVSIDGLQPEHYARRKPATYERILRKHSRSENSGSLHRYSTNSTARRLLRRIS
jgi:organic radical activating enzyme